MIKVRLFLFVLVSFFLIVTYVHALNLQNEILGKWKQIGGTEIIEFFKDGTVSIVDKGEAMAGNYKFVDDTRLRMDIGGLGVLAGPMIVKVSVTRNELLLTQPTGKATKFRKLKVDALGNDADTYINRGSEKNKLGNYQQAIKDLDKAIELDPQNAIAYILRGGTYSLLENYKQAIKDYDKAIELDPKSQWYSTRGYFYVCLGNYQQAIKDYNKAIELDPKNPFPHANRGALHARLGNYQQAIKDCERAIELDPIIGNVGMAYVYSVQNNADMACQSLKRAIEKGYKDWGNLRSNKDFDNIRNTSCFRELIKSR